MNSKQDLSHLSQDALKLCQRAARIAAARKSSQELFEDQEVVDMLFSMSVRDFEKLSPPSPLTAPIWVEDLGFVKRLAAYIFGVSIETIEDLPSNYFIVLQGVLCNAFFSFLDATRSHDLSSAYA